MSLGVNQHSQLKTETLAQKGSATEIAILKFLVKVGFDYEEAKDTYPVIMRKPFNSDRKRMTTII